MTDGPASRRRRRRRGRRAGGDGASAQPRADAQPSADLPDWRWGTLPVFLAFVFGIVIMGLASASATLTVVLFFGALFGLAFGVAHVVSRTIVARRRR